MSDVEAGTVPGYEEEPRNVDPLTNSGVPKRKYSTIKDEVKQAAENKDQVSCCSNICKVLAGSIWSTILLLLFLGIPIAMLVMGAKHLHDCPRQRFIPIYLIVFGVFAILKVLSTFVQRLIAHIKKEEEIPCDAHPHDALKACFLAIWFVAGSVWVYGCYNDYSTIPGDPNYCDETLYKFAFWMVSIFYLALWIALILCCCIRFLLFTICNCAMDALMGFLKKNAEDPDEVEVVDNNK